MAWDTWHVQGFTELSWNVVTDMFILKECQVSSLMLLYIFTEVTFFWFHRNLSLNPNMLNVFFTTFYSFINSVKSLFVSERVCFFAFNFAPDREGKGEPWQLEAQQAGEHVRCLIWSATPLRATRFKCMTVWENNCHWLPGWAQRRDR